MPRDAQSAAVAPTTIRCHRCSKFLGESDRPMEFVGVVRMRDDRELVKPPRATWLCKCGWSNIFVPADPPLARSA
jgi:hypothetical protein